MGKVKEYYFEQLEELDKSIHIGNFKEEWPRDFDLDFVDPMGDVDASSS